MELLPRPLNFADLTEDILSCILSFLSPADISACGCICRRLREICKEERKVWLPMCERRWGSVTHINKWGLGCISYKVLYGTLARWENLIGFWRGVGNGGCGSLVLFDWEPHCIVGYKVVPTSAGGYSVHKIPFLWMSISEDGRILCIFDPASKHSRKANEKEAVSLSAVAGKMNSSPSPRIKAHSPYMDPEATIGIGLKLVDVHFVGNHHLVIEEIVQASSSSVNELAEAAAIAALGPSGSLHESGKISAFKSPSSSGSETDSCVGSPPGSFQYEMYQFLVSKVASTGGERAARKQKRRDKERAWSQGKSLFEPEHFVKVVHSSPTKARPLQGLWKGFFEITGLDFVLVSYDDQGGIVCRRVHDLAGTSKSGSVLWTSKSSARVGTPLPLIEEALYTSRIHIQPVCQEHKQHENSGKSIELRAEEVIGMLCTSSCDFQSLLASNKREGRIWQYASGNFGFGYLHTNSIIDFRVLCSDGCLLDAVD